MEKKSFVISWYFFFPSTSMQVGNPEQELYTWHFYLRDIFSDCTEITSQNILMIITLQKPQSDSTLLITDNTSLCSF